MKAEAHPIPSWRRLPIGAELAPEGGVHFRVWAPDHARVAVVVDGRDAPLARDADGYWSGLVTGAHAGARYRFRLGDGNAYPDPASRSQPDGPHGDSVVVDPGAYAWRDAAWRGPEQRGMVLYELHVGTFTPEGTWRAAMAKLPLLADLGVSCIEMMPVAEFPGRFGWGYDGVDLFAPTRLYGTPDDLRAFVDEAHLLGMGVILDVVYNHVGPDGNWLPTYARQYFSERHHTDWGDAFNFDDDGAGPVREFVTCNARYWVDEFHFDGLRLDATQNIYDDSQPHVIASVAAAVRAAARGRSTFVVGENEPQETWLLREGARDGCALDALWNDDWHHSALVALRGRDEAYYTDYRGRAQEFESGAKYGFLFQGQWYRWQGKRRGTSTRGIARHRLVNFIENHDQVANSGLGLRVHYCTSPSRLRAMTALLLLGPQTPMLFMGQEFTASAPFRYFADHQPQLAALVDAGRRREVSQFPSLALPELQARITRPHDARTFEECRLDWSEREANAPHVALHRDLVRLRRAEPCFSAADDATLDGAVLADDAFVLRWFGRDGDDRLLVVNLGRTLHVDPAPEPLLAPPPGTRWRLRWTSEAPEYGGLGTPALDAADEDTSIPGKPGARRPHENWRITAESASVLVPEPVPASSGTS